MRTKRNALGFGLLEALVAMVMIVSIGVTVVLWIQNGMRSVVRMRDLSEQVRIGQIVGEWSHSVNPAIAPRGKTEVGDYRIEWSSVAIFALAPQAGFPAGIGNHDVGLYEVKVDVFRREFNEPWFTKQLQMVGYVKAREATTPWTPGS